MQRASEWVGLTLIDRWWGALSFRRKKGRDDSWHVGTLLLLTLPYIHLSINQSSENPRRTANKTCYRRKETARLNRELSLEVGIYTQLNTPAAQSGTYARRAPAAEINCRIPSLATDPHAQDLLGPNDSIVSRHESNHWIMFSYFSVQGSTFWEVVLLPTEIRNFPELYCEWYFSNTN